jgi:hypothetical protein
MAFIQISNPGLTPDTVADYELQNNLLSKLQDGLDTACFTLSDDDRIILNSDGIIEYNGALYKILTDIDLTDSIKGVLRTNDTCYLAFNGNSLEAVPDKGDLIVSKNARYLGNKRLLNTMFRYSEIINWNIYNLYVSPASVEVHDNTLVLPTTQRVIIYKDDVISFPSPLAANVQIRSMTDVVYGKGLFVMVGGYSSGGSTKGIFTSPDGVTWTQVYSNSALAEFEIIFGNDMFVMICYSGNNGTAYVFTSADGISWNSASPFGSGLTGICNLKFINGLFYLVDNKNIHSSPDGITWTQLSFTDDISFFAFDGTTVLATRTISSTTQHYYSNNFTDWYISYISEITAGYQKVFYEDGVFMISLIDKFLTSRDCINWKLHDTPFVINKVVYRNRKLYFISTKLLVTPHFVDFGRYDLNTNRYIFSDSVYQLKD